MNNYRFFAHLSLFSRISLPFFWQLTVSGHFWMPPSEHRPAPAEKVRQHPARNEENFNANDYPVIFGVYELVEKFPLLPVGFRQYVYDRYLFNDTIIFRNMRHQEDRFNEGGNRNFIQASTTEERTLAAIRWMYLQLPECRQQELQMRGLKKELARAGIDESILNIALLKLPFEHRLCWDGYQKFQMLYEEQEMDDVIICSTCPDSVRLDSLQAYHNHFLSPSHLVISFFGCDYCNKVFQTKHQYLEHECAGEKQMIFKHVQWGIGCPQCGFLISYNPGEQNPIIAEYQLKKLVKLHMNHDCDSLVAVKLCTSGGKAVSNETSEETIWTGYVRDYPNVAVRVNCIVPGCGSATEHRNAFLRHAAGHISSQGGHLLLSCFLQTKIGGGLLPRRRRRRRFKLKETQGDELAAYVHETAVDPHYIIHDANTFPDGEEDLVVQDGLFGGNVYGTHDLNPFEDKEESTKNAGVPFSFSFSMAPRFPGVEKATARTFMCWKCFLITFGNQATVSHARYCHENSQIIATDVCFTDAYVCQLYHYNHFPNERIVCPLEGCETQCCSIQGFICHLAFTHYIVATIDYQSGGRSPEFREYWTAKPSFVTQEVNLLCQLNKEGRLPVDANTENIEIEDSQEILAILEDGDRWQSGEEKESLKDIVEIDDSMEDEEEEEEKKEEEFMVEDKEGLAPPSEGEVEDDEMSVVSARKRSNDNEEEPTRRDAPTLRITSSESTIDVAETTLAETGTVVNEPMETESPMREKAAPAVEKTPEGSRKRRSSSQNKDSSPASHLQPSTSRVSTITISPPVNILPSPLLLTVDDDDDIQIIEEHPRSTVEGPTEAPEEPTEDDDVIVEVPTTSKQLPDVVHCLTAANNDDDIVMEEVQPSFGRTQTREARFKCDICDKTFLTKGACQKHKDEDHMKDICSLDKKLTSYIFGIPLKGNYFLCPHCTLVFEDSDHHKEHITFHLQLGSALILCDYCSAQSISKDGEGKHLANHGLRRELHGNRVIDRRIAASSIENWCTFCEPHLSFPSDACYYLHVKEIHNVPIFFFCKNCLLGSCEEKNIYDHIMAGSCTEKRVYERTIGFTVATDLHFQPIDAVAHRRKDRAYFVKPHSCSNRSLVKFHHRYATCGETETYMNGETSQCFGLVNFFTYENRLYRLLNCHETTNGFPPEKLPKHFFCNAEHNLYRWLDYTHHGCPMPNLIQYREKPMTYQPELPPILSAYPVSPTGRNLLVSSRTGTPLVHRASPMVMGRQSREAVHQLGSQNAPLRTQVQPQLQQMLTYRPPVLPPSTQVANAGNATYFTAVQAPVHVLPPPPQGAILQARQQNQVPVQNPPRQMNQIPVHNQLRSPQDPLQPGVQPGMERTFICAICNRGRSSKLEITLTCNQREYTNKIMAMMSAESDTARQDIRQRLNSSRSICFTHVNPHGISINRNNKFEIQSLEFLTANYPIFAQQALNKDSYIASYNAFSQQYLGSQMMPINFLREIQNMNRCKYPECTDKQLTTMEAARMHGLHGNTTATFVCQDCWLGFSSEQDAVVHMMTEHSAAKAHGLVNYDLVCPVCRVGYDNIANLVNHFASHAAQLRFLSSICGMRFATEQALLEHEAVHRLAGHSNCCKLCGVCQSFKVVGRGNFRNITHEHRHACSVTYACKICLSQYESHSKLLHHCRLVHNIGGRPPFRCNQCNLGLLDREVLIHIGQTHEVYLFSCAERQPVITCPPGFRELLGLLQA